MSKMWFLAAGIAATGLAFSVPLNAVAAAAAARPIAMTIKGPRGPVALSALPKGEQQRLLSLRRSLEQLQATQSARAKVTVVVTCTYPPTKCTAVVTIEYTSA